MVITNIAVVKMITESIRGGLWNLTPSGVLDRCESPLRGANGVGFIFPRFAAQPIVKNTARARGAFHHQRKPCGTISGARNRPAINKYFDGIRCSQRNREQIRFLGIGRNGHLAFLPFLRLAGVEIEIFEFGSVRVTLSRERKCGGGQRHRQQQASEEKSFFPNTAGGKTNGSLHRARSIQQIRAPHEPS